VRHLAVDSMKGPVELGVLRHIEILFCCHDDLGAGAPPRRPNLGELHTHPRLS
jgi:hypothetical protein